MSSSCDEFANQIQEFIDSFDLERALLKLNEAIELCPSDSRLHRLRASVFLKMGFHERASQEFKFSLIQLLSNLSSFKGDNSTILRAARENNASELLAETTRFEMLSD